MALHGGSSKSLGINLVLLTLNHFPFHADPKFVVGEMYLFLIVNFVGGQKKVILCCKDCFKLDTF